jgi:STAS-like domain of unknown function (DUF4325)
MAIRILEHIQSASTYEDGAVIFKLVLPKVVAREKVVVDFSGVSTVPSAFVNSAFIQLLEHVPFDQVRATLSFTGTTRQINDLIRSRFRFVTSTDRS